VRRWFTRSRVLAVSITVLVLAWAGVALALSAAATADKANNPRSLDPAQTPETCNKSGCHTTLPAAGCSGQVELLGLPGCYVAGQTYRLTVKITDANARRWGFEVGAQYSEGNQWDIVGAGTLATIAGQGTTSVTSADGQRTFITHDGANGGTKAGTVGPASWDFNWTAPAGTTRQTKVCFYVAGLAANNDDTRSGDCTYTAKLCVNPCGPVETHDSTWGSLKAIYR